MREELVEELSDATNATSKALGNLLVIKRNMKTGTADLYELVNARSHLQCAMSWLNSVSPLATEEECAEVKQRAM